VLESTFDLIYVTAFNHFGYQKQHQPWDVDWLNIFVSVYVSVWAVMLDKRCVYVQHIPVNSIYLNAYTNQTHGIRWIRL